MKTRIISGAVMAAIVVAVLWLGFNVSFFFISLFIALIAAVGTYELLKNAAGIKSKAAVISGAVYTSLAILVKDTDLVSTFLMKGEGNPVVSFFISNWLLIPSIIAVLYFILSVVFILKNHKDFNLAGIVTLVAMPMLLSYAFSCLGSVLSNASGLYYLLLLLNFSSICDMGAYFVGVTCGKHKLCPEISPKKTVEGAVGGLVLSLIVSVILLASFNMFNKFTATMILTVPFCVLGMIGDLFASSIKRAVGIKDYGNLIPGHGGILDRVDSILMIAPLLYLCISIGVL